MQFTPPSVPRKPSAWLALGWLAAMILVASIAPARVSAHAELVTSDPIANSSLVEAPSTLTVTFSEPIDPDRASIEVLDLQLRPVAGVGPARVDPEGVTVTLDLPVLDPDVYTVRYDVVSTTDGHTTSGFYAFIVDPTGAQAPPSSTPTATSPSADALAVAARWLSLLGTLIGLGTLVTWWHSGRPLGFLVPWRLVAVSSFVGAGALAVYLMLSARTIPPGPGGLPFDPAAAFGWTPFAVAMRVALLGGLLAGSLAILGAIRGSATGRWLVVAVALAVGTSLAGMSAGGHGSSLGGPVNGAIDWLHLVAAAAWLGGIPAIYVMGRRTATRDVLRRHGRLALVAAPLVILTGVANSPLVLGSARGLVASEYGNLLLAKATLASIALAIGAVNHFLLRGRGRGSASLLVAAELSVAVVAVLAAATMVTVQPAAARQDVVIGPAIQPAHFFGEAGPTSIHASVSIPAPGRQTYQVTLRDADTGAPRDDIQKVFLEFTPVETIGLGTERIELEPNTLEGLYSTAAAATPVIGEWQMRVVVRRAGALDESVEFGMAVQEPGPALRAPPPDTGIGVPSPMAALWTALPSGLSGWIPAFALLGLGIWLGRVHAGLARLRIPVLALAVILFLGVGSRSLVEGANRPTVSDLAPYASAAAGDPEIGERIYRANCAACHGTDGTGDGPVRTAVTPRSLADRVPALSDAEVSYRIATGTAGTPMPAFAASLTEQERDDLVSYLRARWGTP